MKKILAVVLFVLTLPVLLFVYQPSWQLGAFGLLLGGIGMTLSPLAMLGLGLYGAYTLWKSGDRPQM